jgi:hypothetical protein
MTKHQRDLRDAIAAADKGEKELLRLLRSRGRTLDWYFDAVLEDIIEDRKDDKIRQEFGRLPK